MFARLRLQTGASEDHATTPAAFSAHVSLFTPTTW